MNDVLADTHSVVWLLFDPGRLSTPAAAALAAASQAGRVFISSISLVELDYLAGKVNFPYSGVLPRLVTLVSDPTEPIDVLPLTLEVAQAMAQVPRAEIPGMPDRIVAATAVAHNLPLVSADADIRNSTSLKQLVNVIW
jgi:PIN domain nuclease of toxin-antitoxin system